MLEFLQHIGNIVFTEAGILAFILFWYGVFITLELRSVRIRKDNALKEQTDKVFVMGMGQIEASTKQVLVMQQISTNVRDLTDLLERNGIKAKENAHDIAG